MKEEIARAYQEAHDAAVHDIMQYLEESGREYINPASYALFMHSCK